MIKISGYAFFAGAALAVFATLGGCSGSSSSPAAVSSAEGESCSRSADCASGLVCIDNACAPKGTINDAGQMIGPDGEIITATPDSGVTVISDATVIVPPPMEAAAPPRLSGVGEYCVSAAECAAGLVCIPNSPYGGSGVCDLGSYGLTPTGKTCSGECNTPADCCELPLNTSVMNTAVKTCQDIVNVLAGNTTQCTTGTPPSATSTIGIGCFLYAAYCGGCSASTWACTKNQCVYTASCQNSGVELNGCPSVTRTGRTLNTNCDSTDGGSSGSCKPTVVGSCAADADCDTKPTTDSAITCRAGNCACYQQGCYLKCASDLDCHQGYSCSTTKLCTQTAGCSTNADCANSTANVTAQCVSGQCKIPCKSDHQCSASGVITNYVLTSSFGGSVCGSDGYCGKVGCTSDADCNNSASNPGGNTLHLFCVTPPATSTTAVVQSALTN